MGACSVRELWGRSSIARACGGYINKIIEAVLHEPTRASTGNATASGAAGSAGEPLLDRIWDIEFRHEVLELGNQIEDATYLVLKDFVEPPWEYGEDDEEEDDGINIDEEEDDSDEPAAFTASDIAAKVSKMRILGGATKTAAKVKPTEMDAWDPALYNDPNFQPRSTPVVDDSAHSPSAVLTDEWTDWGVVGTAQNGGTPAIQITNEPDAEVPPGWD